MIENIKCLLFIVMSGRKNKDQGLDVGTNEYCGISIAYWRNYQQKAHIHHLIQNLYRVEL